MWGHKKKKKKNHGSFYNCGSKYLIFPMKGHKTLFGGGGGKEDTGYQDFKTISFFSPQALQNKNFLYNETLAVCLR